jgi:hypothetical protein
MPAQKPNNMEAIKNQYMDAPILLASHWDLKFHVHTNVLNLVMGAMLTCNITSKCDQ